LSRPIHIWRSENPRGSGEDRLAGLLIRFGINALALFLASQWVRGVEVEGWESLLIAAAIFGVVNAVIRPAVLVLSCPFLVLTLGLFTLIVNTAMLALTAWVSGHLSLEFDVEGFRAAFLGALLISAVSVVLSATVGRRLRRALR
jgi:putative membrane protein